MNAFFDSSAFAKLFVVERGTPKVAEAYFRATTKAVSALGWLEVRSAIARRERLGDLNAIDAALAVSMLQAEVSNTETITVSSDLLVSAETPLISQQLRSLDAIQLAACLQWAKQVTDVLFVCADRRLREAAAAEGLAVLDPEAP
jgi:predicted nucleic acid-binding protein